MKTRQEVIERRENAIAIMDRLLAKPNMTIGDKREYDVFVIEKRILKWVLAK